jgi:hypothetical protein
MRHVISPKAVTTRPFGMGKAAAAAVLIASAGFAQRPPARFLRTALATVNLAAIAMAADEHLGAATPAQKKPGRRFIVVRAIGAAWTHPTLGAIIPLHSCPRTM